ncbi:MAG: hypothetical protein AAGA75_09305 [Cyanobacteria bacterium P01_E01_bin.6]
MSPYPLLSLIHRAVVGDVMTHHHSIHTDKYLDIIKIKTPNPVLPAQWAAQDLEGYV